MFFRDESSLWLNLFISGKFKTQFHGIPASLSMESKLPYEGLVSITVETTGEGTLKLRLPDYARNPIIRMDGKEILPQMEKGYILVPVIGNSQISYHFEMAAELIYANPSVPANAGKCAVKKGPLVYCLEGQDNGVNLSGLLLDPAKSLREFWDDELFGGALTITAEGYRLNCEDFGNVLYRNRPPTYERTELRFIPYCFWANREEGEMTVWVNYLL